MAYNHFIHFNHFNIRNILDRIQGELENDDLEYSRRRRILYFSENKNGSNDNKLEDSRDKSSAEIKFSTRRHGLRRSRSIDLEARNFHDLNR